MQKFIYPSRIKVSNLGDVLINVLLIRELSAIGLVCLDGEINSLDKLIKIDNKYAANIKVIKGVRAFSGKPMLRWINMLNLLFTANYVFDPPGAYSDTKDTRKLRLKFFKYYTRALVLKLFGIKMMRVGVSMGPFSQKGLKRQQKLSTVYKNIALRDSANFKYLKENNFKNISLEEDLAFLYEAQNFQSFFKTGITDTYIVVSLRSDIESDHFNKAYMEAMVKAVAAFLQKSLPARCKIIYSYQVKEDLAAIQYVQQQLKKNYNITGELLPQQLDFSAAISLYHSAGLVITNRLHVGLLALLNNTVSLIFTDAAKHHKLVNIFKDLALQDLIADVYNYSQVQYDLRTNWKYLESFNQLKLLKAQSIKNYLEKQVVNK